MKIPKKQRLSVYLDPDITKALAAYAARRDQSRSLVAEAAIASFLSPDAAERQEAATTKRLDQLDRRMTRMERDLGISVEMLAVFVRFWLTTNPPLPEPAQAAARAQAGERYDAFVAALGRRLAKGPKVREEISDDVVGVRARNNHRAGHRKSLSVPPSPSLCTPEHYDPVLLVVMP